VIGPDFRHLLHQLPEGRKGRSATQERLRTQLLACLPQDSTHRIPVQAAPELLNRSLLANMEGEATIMADGFESRFVHGHWRGLFPSGDPAAPGIRMRDPSGASLVIRGKTWPYEVESSVSFETDHARGLRNALVLKMPGSHIPGRMMMDYVLSDHSPHLLIDIQIRYPWLEDTPLIDEVHPCRLGIGLPDDCQNLVVSCQHLQEPPREYHPCDAADPGEGGPVPRPATWWQRLLEPLRHPAGEGRPTCRWEKVFYGKRWTVSWEHRGKRQGLALLRLPGEQQASAPLEMRLNQESNGKGLTLELFPEGRYRNLPNADLRSLNHHFVLGVLPIFDPYAPIPELHDRVEKDCSPFFMIRES
jgi:hypothetical protein